MFRRKAQAPAPNPLPRELERMVDVWPQLSDRTRFGLMMVSGLSLLKNFKLGAGLATLGSGLRFESGVILREARHSLGNAGRRIGGWLQVDIHL